MQSAHLHFKSEDPQVLTYGKLKGTSRGLSCFTESLEISYYKSVVCWLWLTIDQS